MKKAYVVTLILKHPSQPNDQLIYSPFLVAEDEAAALQRAKDNLSEGEFLSDTRDWEITHHTVGFVGEEHIEEAAIEVLGWKSPTDPT